MRTVAQKRVHEKNLVSQMITLYCRKKHRTTKARCKECQQLNRYAQQRIDQCPFLEGKTFCSGCKTPCYTADMRRQIRTVMRFAGPRMLWYHPIIVLRHGIEKAGSKREETR